MHRRPVNSDCVVEMTCETGKKQLSTVIVKSDHEYAYFEEVIECETASRITLPFRQMQSSAITIPVRGACTYARAQVARIKTQTKIVTTHTAHAHLHKLF